MNKNKKLEIGTEVLIFNYDKTLIIQDENCFIKGIVKSSNVNEVKNNIVQNYTVMYTVIGEDLNEYFGTYLYSNSKETYFRTIEDHIYFLKLKIYRNNKKIKQLENQKNTSEKIIDWLKKENYRLINIIQTFKKDRTSSTMNVPNNYKLLNEQKLVRRKILND